MVLRLPNQTGISNPAHASYAEPSRALSGAHTWQCTCQRVHVGEAADGRRVALLEVAQRAALGRYPTPAALEAAVHDMASQVRLLLPHWDM